MARHLKLTADQVLRLNAAAEQQLGQMRPDLDRLGRLDEKQRGPRGQELLRTFNRDILRSAGDILEADQLQRFRQLEMQRRGFDAFADPDIRRRLGLSEDQLNRLQDAGRRGEQQMRTISDRGQLDPQAGLRQYQDFLRGNEDLLGRTLTPRQMQSWRDFAGQPYAFAPPFLPLGGSGSGQGTDANTEQTGEAGYGKPGRGDKQAASKEKKSDDYGKGGKDKLPQPDSSPKNRPGRLPASESPSPFPEPLFRMDHVVRALNISREQFDRLATLTGQLQHRFRPELDRSDRLDGKERDARVRELLRDYSSEWMKGAAEIFTRPQMAQYIDLEARGGVAELRAGPDALRQRSPKPPEK